MLIRFFNHGSGSTARAVNYLLSDHDHKGDVRESVEVLDGHPDLVAFAGDSIERKWKYSSAVLAWAEGDNPTREQEREALDAFLEMAGAGMPDPDLGLTYVAVRHVASPPHIHVILVREDAATGKAYNPAPPGWQKDYRPLQDLLNARFGWADPGDPTRARPHAGDRGRRNRDDERSHIEHEIYHRSLSGEFRTRESLVAACSDYGEVTRVGRDYVSIKPDGHEKAMRFKSVLFRSDNPTEAATELVGKPEPAAADIGKEVEAALAVDAALAERRRWWQTEEEKSDDRDTIGAGNRRPERSPTHVAVGAATAGDRRSVVAAGERATRASRDLVAVVEETHRAVDTSPGRGLWARAWRGLVGYVRSNQKDRPQHDIGGQTFDRARAALARIASRFRPATDTTQPASQVEEPLAKNLFGSDAEPPTPPGTTCLSCRSTPCRCKKL